MPAAAGHALGEERPGPREVYKLHPGGSGSEQVAIAPLERRAGGDEADARALCFAQSGRDGQEPAFAVVVRERDPGGHAPHVVRRVQVITFDEFNVEFSREPRADEALAGARNAHDHVEPGVHSDLSYTIDRFGAILLAYANLQGAATMQLA